ncbi:MAG: lipoprotein-releasing system ATP-binding protein, partial [Thermoleophilaceae bacterium]|nr:lipoprotein-releasing system ATP-binding protein [Thermoleophilaceae bacterium]
AELLERVGLAHRMHHRPRELSGGEMQRAAIARALMSRPRVLLADEPTGNLDTGTGDEIMALMHRLAEERGQTIVLITHDQGIAERAPRLVRMRDGRIESAAAAP